MRSGPPRPPRRAPAGPGVAHEQTRRNRPARPRQADGTGGLCSYGYNSNSSFAPTGPGLDLDDVDAVKNNCELFAGGQVVFGVSINLVPSCEVAQQNFSDPWMAGSYSTSQQNVGSYQLSYATGIGSGPGSFLDGSASPSERIDLPTPTSKTKVRTWVSVVE